MSRKSIAVCALMVALTTGSTRAGIVHEQPPSMNSGYAGDLEFVDDSGQNVWQQTADDFRLVNGAVIYQISWYGFFGGRFVGTVAPPSGNEIIRARFYAARPSDGLPGVALYEETFVNPARTATGNLVVDVRGHPEFLYTADLSWPLALSANATYWLEIVQVDDVGSHFRWEGAGSTGSPLAYMNLFVSDWTLTTPLNDNMAFRLSSIPEPATLVFAFLGILSARREGHRPRRRR